MRSSSTRVGAVVAGGDYQGLGIVRSLGRRGIPVIVIDDEPSIARFSRYTDRAFRVPDLRSHEATVSAVLDLGRKYGLNGWVLYPTRDEMVAAFSLYRDDLEKVYRVPTPGWDVVKWAWDKRLTYERAQQLGIPTPLTWYASDPSMLSELGLEFPVVLKPAIKEHFIYAMKVKAMRADTREQLAACFQQASEVVPPAEIMIQELVPGGGESQFSYCGFFKNGTPVASMLARRTRQRPPDFGRSSTCVETVDLPEVKELSEQFLEAIDYYGLVEVEFKFDRRVGEYKLLDVNPRTWGYHSVGYSAGVDFPYLLFEDQLGASVERRNGKPGVRWIRLTTDIPTALSEIFHGRLDWRLFLRSILRFQSEPVFAWRDPVPALAELTLLPYLIRTRSARRWFSRPQ